MEKVILRMDFFQKEMRLISEHIAKTNELIQASLVSLDVILMKHTVDVTQSIVRNKQFLDTSKHNSF